MERNNVSENIIAAKLRSERGASITFALLLFLVCAALSAVILVAATTASGRMAGIAETDQRYYSVTSAAELVANLVDGKTVTVIWFKDDTNEHYVIKSAASIKEDDFDDNTTLSVPDVDSAAEADVADIDSAPIYGSLDSDSQKKMLEKLANMVINNSGDASWIISSSNDTSTDALNNDYIATDVKAYLKKKGNLYFDVCNAKGGPFNSADSKFRPYTLRVEFDTEKKEGVELPVGTVNGKKVDRTIEIKWRLKTIQTPYDDKNS